MLVRKLTQTRTYYIVVSYTNNNGVLKIPGDFNMNISDAKIGDRFRHSAWNEDEYVEKTEDGWVTDMGEYYEPYDLHNFHFVGTNLPIGTRIYFPGGEIIVKSDGWSMQ